jgi:hypothetical protein
VTAWGARGVKDGLADYKRLNQNAEYKYGAAVEVLASFSYSADTAKRMGQYSSDPISFIKKSAGF